MTEETLDTTAEIDELLDEEPREEAHEAAADGAEEVLEPLSRQSVETPLGHVNGNPVLPFDFRRPYNISKAFEKNVLTICEAFAKASSLTFTTLLRANVVVEHTTLKLSTFGDYVRSLPDLSCVATVSLPPLAGQSLLLVDIQTSFVLMKRLLGGTFEPENESRKFTDVEFALADIFMRRFLENFRSASEKTVPMEAELNALENNPAFLGTMSNGETVILLNFAIATDEMQGEIVVCIPLTAFEPVWSKFSPEEHGEYRNSEEVERDRRRVFDTMQHSGADVIVKLAEISMPLDRVLELKEGDMVSLNQSVHSKLTVEVQGKEMFRGVPGKLNNLHALKITERIRWEE